MAGTLDIRRGSSFVLANMEGAEGRKVSLRLTDDGSIEILSDDFGERQSMAWCRVDGSAIEQVAITLLAEKFEGKFAAVSELAQFCEEHKIRYYKDMLTS